MVTWWLKGLFLVLLGPFGALGATGQVFDVYSISDSEYYSMPQLYELDEYYGCLGRGGVYCFGQFELSAPPGNELLQRIQQYSEDWVRHSNHSRMFRGLCVSRRCPGLPHHEDREWFASCVNWSMTSEYNMSARLMPLNYCTRELQGKKLHARGEAFIGFLVVLLIIATVSTMLDLKLSDDSKKSIGWLLSWSVVRSWRTLTEAVQATDRDLRFLDGFRVICMMVIIALHTVASSVVVNVEDTRFYEQNSLVLVNGNLTLLVQVFFIVASFLMARKVIQQKSVPVHKNFVNTMKNRFVRILPSYMVVTLYMVTLHDHFGSGPMWRPAVQAEVDRCQETWWMNMLFINNFNTGSKCQIQTWHLAADMQLYAAGLLLTLLLRGRRAVPVMTLLLATTAILYVCMAYAWHLMPVYTLHVPENLQCEYSGVATFDLLYQSPWGNAFASLTGLLLAHAHHSLKTFKYDLHSNKAFRWAARLAAPSLLVFIIVWPCTHPLGPPTRFRSVLEAALIGPALCLLTALMILDQLQGYDSMLRRLLSSRAMSVLARLSLAVMLVHFPVARIQLATRDYPEHLHLFKLMFNMFGVWSMSYALAVPLAVLVELPAQRLYRELSGAGPAPNKRND